MFHVKHRAPVGPPAAPAKQPHASKNRPMISMPGGAHRETLFACPQPVPAGSGAHATASARRMPPRLSAAGSPPRAFRRLPAQRVVDEQTVAL